MFYFKHKKESFLDFLKQRKERKRKSNFQKEFSFFAEKSIETSESKFLACFAFDGDTSRILIDGSPEKEEFDCIFHYLESKKLIRGIALDVGANYGMHSLRFAKHYKYVHSFEPHPAVYKLLSTNVCFNNPNKNIHTHNIGLSQSKSISTLFDHKSRNIGGSTLEKNKISANQNTVTFQCKLDTMDAIFLDIEDRIGLIKIDTEGHEASVILGGSKTINKYKPVIIFEDWDSKNGIESETVKTLRSIGYKTFLVPGTTILNAPSLQTSTCRRALHYLQHGRQFGLHECDFSSPKGYDLLVAHF